jgi:SAM-dependent methyltransferase
MRQDDRVPFFGALQRARASAYPPGEFVDQEGFMLAGEILALARRAGIAPRVSVLDLCCGVAGPGRLITRELGCTYLGVDYSADALGIARKRAGELPCRFEVSRIPPIPAGPFDVVLMFETMLAFRDKKTLLQEVSEALTTGGRFTFTIEEGLPLTDECPTPTPFGSRRCRRCSAAWRAPGCSCAGGRTTAGPTVRSRIG